MDILPSLTENNTLSVNDTLILPTEDPSQFLIIKWIFLVTICLTTITSNILVLYLFWKSKKGLNSPTHFLLANLAVADFLVGAVIMPILITITTSPTYYWIWGELICSLFDYIHYPLCATSMLSMMGIAIERYIGVKYPLQHKQNMTKKRVLCSIVLIWILAFLLTSVPLTVWSAPTMPLPNLCVMNLTQNFLLFITFGVYWIPLSTTVVIYTLVYRNAVQPFAKVLNNKEEKYRKYKAKQITLAKKVGLVVGLLLIMFGPLFVTFILCAFMSPLYSFDLLALTGWLRYFNSTLNPFVYAFAVPGYKREFFRIFTSQHRQETDLSSSVSETYDEQTDSMETSERSSTLTNQGADPLGKISTTVQKVDLVLNRFCTYCGNRLNQNLMKNQGNHCYCSDCFAKFAEGKATFVATKPSSPPNQYQTREPRIITQSLDTHKTTPTACPILQEALAKELENILRATTNKSSDNRTGNLVREGGNKLLSNLMTRPKTGPRERLNSVKRIRESVMMPIIERQSKMLSESKNPEEIDWDVIKELDEIIEKLNSTIIKPLLMDQYNE